MVVPGCTFVSELSQARNGLTVEYITASRYGRIDDRVDTRSPLLYVQFNGTPHANSTVINQPEEQAGNPQSAWRTEQTGWGKSRQETRASLCEDAGARSRQRTLSRSTLRRTGGRRRPPLSLPCSMVSPRRQSAISGASRPAVRKWPPRCSRSKPAWGRRAWGMRVKHEVADHLRRRACKAWLGATMPYWKMI